MAFTKWHAVTGVGEVNQDRAGTIGIELEAGGSLLATTYTTTNQTHGAKSIAYRHPVVMEAARDPLRNARISDSMLVRVIEIHGVGLREATDGAVLTFSSDPGSRPTIAGSVLRGTVDDELRCSPQGERTVRTVSISRPVAEDAGLLCGGSARILITPVADLPGEALDWLGATEPVVLVAAADGSGLDMALSPAGVAGSVGSDDEAIFIARQLLRQGTSGTQLHVIDGVELSFTTAVPHTRTLIVGSGPMAAAFQAQGELLGWTVSLTDSAAEAESFCAEASAADALIVISHDRDLDVPALAAALGSPIGYIGAMGSRSTQTARADMLEAQGFTDRDRICGPIGLDLGSRSPAETAVAMAAEFLSVRRGAPPVPLSGHAGPIHS